MSQAPQPDAAGRADAKGGAGAAPGTDAAPLSPSPRGPAGGTPKRAALTVAALAGLAVTALPWLPLAAISAATTGHRTLATANHHPTASAPHRPGATVSHHPVAADHNDRGQLVSATPLRTLATTAAVRTELRKDGFSAASARYGVRSYRLIYRTIDAHGRPTTASGLLALPISGQHQLPVISFTHGTEVYRGDAPSMAGTGFVPAPAYTYASAGFAAAEPDYLGLGRGPGLQPWMDVPSETTTALDMLRAARAYVTSHGQALGHQVMISGFSQGASAALGLARVLRDHADPWFRLGALAPISGAYDMAHVEIPAILNGELISLNPNRMLGAKNTVLCTALFLVAANRVHRIYTSPAEVFRPPYARTIERLLDGNYTGQQPFSGTPDTLHQLLTKRGLQMFRHPTGALAAQLRTDDSVCTGWSPAAPARLYYATRDEQAVNANTFGCQAAFAAHGAEVPVIDLGTPNDEGSRHLGSNAAGTGQVVRWFSQLVQHRTQPA